MGLIDLGNTLKIGIKFCPHIPRDSRSVHIAAFLKLQKVAITWFGLAYTCMVDGGFGLRKSNNF